MVAFWSTSSPETEESQREEHSRPLKRTSLRPTRRRGRLTKEKVTKSSSVSSPQTPSLSPSCLPLITSNPPFSDCLDSLLPSLSHPFSLSRCLSLTRGHKHVQKAGCFRLLQGHEKEEEERQGRTSLLLGKTGLWPPGSRMHDRRFFHILKECHLQGPL